MKNKQVSGAICISMKDFTDKGKENNSQAWADSVRLDQFSLPFPLVLVGSGTALWDNVQRSVCPSCKNRQLGIYEYCLRCDSWGMDPYVDHNLDNINIDEYVENITPLVNVTDRLAKIFDSKKVVSYA